MPSEPMMAKVSQCRWPHISLEYCLQSLLVIYFSSVLCAVASAASAECGHSVNATCLSLYGKNLCCSIQGICGLRAEHCAPMMCQSECLVKAPVCGDGICSGFLGETCVSCSADCGICYYDTSDPSSFPTPISPVVSHVDPSLGQLIATITFDDGPTVDGGITSDLLDVLKAENVSAAFFVVGENLENAEARRIARRAVSEGHLVLSHSYNHANFSTLSRKEIIRQMEATDVLIHRSTCRRPLRLMRQPYGEMQGVTLLTLADLGYASIYWDFASNDWQYYDRPDGSQLTRDEFFDLIDSRYPGSMLYLQHDVNVRSTSVTRDVLRRLKSLDYRFLRLDAVLNISVFGAQLNWWSDYSMNDSCIDENQNVIGGASCESDFDCNVGYCSNQNICVCNPGWTCPYCDMLSSTMTYGSDCTLSRRGFQPSNHMTKNLTIDTFDEPERVNVGHTNLLGGLTGDDNSMVVAETGPDGALTLIPRVDAPSYWYTGLQNDSVFGTGRNRNIARFRSLQFRLGCSHIAAGFLVGLVSDDNECTGGSFSSVNVSVYWDVQSMNNSLVEIPLSDFVSAGLTHWFVSRIVLENFYSLTDGVKFWIDDIVLVADSGNPFMSPYQEPLNVETVSTVSLDGFSVRHPCSGDFEAASFLDGVNLGNTKPGYFPGDQALTYDDFYELFTMTANIGLRAVRVYSLMSPAFYRALAAFNAKNPSQPMWLLQGIWSPLDGDEANQSGLREDLGPRKVGGADFWHPYFASAFYRMIQVSVQAVHGDLRLDSSEPGFPAGVYETDVSRYTLAWIVGSEFDPHCVNLTNHLHRDAAFDRFGLYQNDFQYVAVGEGATATERFLAWALELVARLDSSYGMHRALGLINWVSTDPLHHPSDPEEDIVSVDQARVRTTVRWKGHDFCAHNVYPYYPSLMKWPAPGQRADGLIDEYEIYLVRLRSHFASLPLMISEYGLPTSVGRAQTGPRGRNHGGIDERAQADEIIEMEYLARRSGLVGALIFSLVDEWFKRCWNVMEMQLFEGRPRWKNVLSAEQGFGVISADPAFPILLDGSSEDWEEPGRIALFPVTQSNASMFHITHDESFLYIRVDKYDPLKGNLFIGFDLNETRGSTQPHLTDGSSHVDVPEFLLAIDTILAVQNGSDATFFVHQSLDYARRKWSAEYGAQFYNGVDDFAVAVLPVSSKLVRQDTNETFPAEYHYVGRFRKGSSVRGDVDYSNLHLWNFNVASGLLEVRIPWTLLGVADPSSRTAFSVTGMADEGDFSVDFYPFEHVSVEVITCLDVSCSSLMRDGASYSWTQWTRPQWKYSAKLAADALRSYFRPPPLNDSARNSDGSDNSSIFVIVGIACGCGLLLVVTLIMRILQVRRRNRKLRLNRLAAYAGSKLYLLNRKIAPDGLPGSPGANIASSIKRAWD